MEADRSAIYAIYREFLAADEAWSVELRREFGKDAGTARYQTRGEGEPGSALNMAYTKWCDVRFRYDDAICRIVADRYGIEVKPNRAY